MAAPPCDPAVLAATAGAALPDASAARSVGAVCSERRPAGLRADVHAGRSALNPVVVVAPPSVPGQPKDGAGQVGASFLTAVLMGWAWSRWPYRVDHPPATRTLRVRIEVAGFLRSGRQDFSGGGLPGRCARPRGFARSGAAAVFEDVGAI